MKRNRSSWPCCREGRREGRLAQRGGACGKAFRAETFDEIAEMSKQHGMEMFKAKDAPHLEAMSRMRDLMQKPDAMSEWFDGRRAAFEALPDD